MKKRSGTGTKSGSMNICTNIYNIYNVDEFTCSFEAYFLYDLLHFSLYDYVPNLK